MSRVRMESVSGSDVRLRRVGAEGSGHMARQEFTSGRSRWCDGAGAWHITAKHRMNIALRHQGCTWR